MQKKIIALCVLLTSVTYVSANSGYPATPGYQPSQSGSEHKHHHHHTDSITDQSDANRLRILDQEDKDGYYYTNLAKVGVFIGIGVTAAGWLMSDPKIIGTGVTIGVGSGVTGFFVGERETQRAMLRTQERSDINKRRQGHHH